MNILITGGNGFLGSSIVKKLVNENHNVLVVSKNNNNLKSVENKYRFISSYIDELETHINDIESFLPDVILLFGWNGANSYKDIHHIDQYYKNIPDHIKFIELINKFKFKPKIIGVGSFAEYGNYPIPITEEFFERPNSLYGLSKFTFKQYSEMFCKQNDINWSWIRPCFIYGPNDVKTRLIPNVIQKCLKNENIELDECNKVIDYLYIDDFVNMVYKIIDLNACGVYNICSGNQYHLRNIIDLIFKSTNSNSKITYNKSLNRKTNDNVICGNNEKIKKVIGESSLLNINDGIQKTIEFYDYK
jgi:nucleoside-diphosphate-sugar epimerase